MFDLTASARLARVVAAGLVALLLSAGAARCETTVAFYSHGWGFGPNGVVYLPHAFVVVRHSDGPADPPQEVSYGYTAADDTDIRTLFAHPAKGEIGQPNPIYRQKAVLHFTVTATEDEYAALRRVLDAWGGPGAPLYNLKTHNCVGFAADVAKALDLEIPATIGEDPAKFLEGVRRLNAPRLTEASATTAATAP